jgi:predicted DNA-binding protein (MmcQ/YjbR family)
VRNKLFAMYASAGTHHGGGRPAVWIKAKSENQAAMLALRPDRFFRPPYVGPSGWVGVWLDGPVDWDEVGALLTDGWRLTAPKRLLATFDG